MGITEPICASQTLQLLPPQSTLVLERSHSELNSVEACLIGRNTLVPRNGKSGSSWRPKKFSGSERQHKGSNDQPQNPKPIVAKGYRRCCRGNYRAHMRIPDVTVSRFGQSCACFVVELVAGGDLLSASHFRRSCQPVHVS